MAQGIHMKHQALHFVLILTLLLFSGSTTYGQSAPLPGNKKPRTLDDYQPRTLKEITTLESALAGYHDKESGVILHGNILPSRVKVTYTGSTRTLPRSRKDILFKWAQRFAGNPAHYTVPYETEMLFIEDGTKHWLAVKKDFAPETGKEMKKGEEVYLYLIRLGTVRNGGEWEWLMLVENYQKPK